MELIVKPYDWTNYEKDSVSELLCWSLDRNSNTTLVRFEFPTFVYLEIPTFCDNKFVKWTKETVEPLIQDVKDSLACQKHDPIIAVFMKIPKMYYYKGAATYPFILLSFHKVSAIKALQGLIHKKFKVEVDGNIVNVKFTTYETDISNDRKLTAMKELGNTQWMKVKADQIVNNQVVDDTSTIKISKISEYKGLWNTIIPISREESKTWIVNPIILTFDGEMYSDNKKAMPRSSNPQHFIFQISVVVKRLLSEEKQKYSLVFGDYTPDIEGTIKYPCRTELELLQQFANIIDVVKPNLILSYNGFGFDWLYFNTRMEMHGGNWNNIGLLKDKPIEMTKIDWKSNTYGKNELKFLQIDGIVNFDLYQFVKKTFTLRRNNLQFVGNYFLQRGKLDISPEEMFIAVEKYWDGVNTRDPEKIQDANTCMREVAKYNVEDSNLTVDLFEKLNVWNTVSEASDITGINMQNIYTKGLQQRVMSRIYLECKRRNMMIDKGPNIEDDEKLGGGFVMTPVVGRHKNVIILDFKSMYPSITMGYNIDYTTILSPLTEKNIPDDKTYNIEWDEPIRDTKDNIISYERKKYRFMKEPTGIVPHIFNEMLKERQRVKEEMKTTSDEILKSTLDARQQSIKLLNNSVVGIWGSKKSKMSFIEGNMTVTAIGRDTIKKTKEYVESLGLQVIYSDTDSLMIKTCVEKSSELYDFGKKLEEEINKRFAPLTIELEKQGTMIALEKKKYVFWPMDKDGNPLEEDKIMYKGVVTVRKGTCQWVKDVYKKIMESILHEKPLEDTYNIILEEMSIILNNKIDHKNLVMSNDAGENYKNKTFYTKIFADRLRTKGKTIVAGDLLEYIIVTDPPNPEKRKIYLGEKLREPKEYVESIGTTQFEPIDVQYYLEHYLEECIDSAFNAGYKTELSKENLGCCSLVNQSTNVVYPINQKPIKNLLMLFTKRKITLEDLPNMRCVKNVILT